MRLVSIDLVRCGDSFRHRRRWIFIMAYFPDGRSPLFSFLYLGVVFFEFLWALGSSGHGDEFWLRQPWLAPDILSSNEANVKWNQEERSRLRSSCKINEFDWVVSWVWICSLPAALDQCFRFVVTSSRLLNLFPTVTGAYHRIRYWRSANGYQQANPVLYRRLWNRSPNHRSKNPSTSPCLQMIIWPGL